MNELDNATGKAVNVDPLVSGPAPIQWGKHLCYREWLDENGYDGLYVSGTCACDLSDLAPCGEGPSSDCKPGYKHFDPRPEHKKCGDWAIFSSKDEPDFDDWDHVGY